MESRLRSVTKTVVFRAVALAGTFLITWIITGNVAETTGITVVIHLYLTAIYYANERVWDRLGWGRMTPEVPERQARMTPLAEDD
jgi:uncharacterized membrane protein